MKLSNSLKHQKYWKSDKIFCRFIDRRLSKFEWSEDAIKGFFFSFSYSFFIKFSWIEREEKRTNFKLQSALCGEWSNWIVNYMADLYWDLFHLIYSFFFLVLLLFLFLQYRLFFHKTSQKAQKKLKYIFCANKATIGIANRQLTLCYCVRRLCRAEYINDSY